jgi:hypothetical protein
MKTLLTGLAATVCVGTHGAEHPRLFFGRTDGAELRQRAATPEGRIIVKQLHELLAHPPSLEQSQTGDTRRAGLWAAGQAFAYTLSGDAKDAEAARRIVQQCIAMPVINMPELRRGTRYMGLAIAYDLCYDAWPAEFREQVARYLAVRADGLLTRREGVKASDNPAPQSNHNVEGRTQMGVIALAIHGDPGAGDKTGEIIAAARRDLDGWLREAIGDRGFGGEGEAFTLNCLNWGVAQFVVAHERVLGEPATKNEALRWILPLVMMRVVGNDLPYHGPQVAQWTGSKEYGCGFWGFGNALIPAALQPAWRTFVADRFGQTFPLVHPAEAIWLLVGAPWTQAGRPLEGILPRAVCDQRKGFVMFRDRYGDADDLLVTGYFHSDPKRASWRCRPAVHIWGRGQQWLKFDPTRITDDRQPGPQITKFDPAGSITAGAFAMQVNFPSLTWTDATPAPLPLETTLPVTLAADGRSFVIRGTNGATLHGTLDVPADGRCVFANNELALPAGAQVTITIQEKQR